jgi:hypothetical protein
MKALGYFYFLTVLSIEIAIKLEKYSITRVLNR